MKTIIKQNLRVGAAAVELLQTKQHEFIGLGAVSISGVPVRNAAEPVTLRLDTPDGILYTRLIVEKVKRVANRVEIVLQAIGLPWERGEYQDDYAQAVMWMQSQNKSIVDRLTLVLSPVSLEAGGQQWTGLSYAFEFASSSRQIHRLLTHATWEIGGRITGNTVLSQGQCNMPVYRGAKNKLFTTACLRTLDQHGKPQGNSFQLGPRAGLIQGFDFQHARQGALWQWWPKFDSISSLIESPIGSDVLHVIDEYRFELANRVRTTPKWVLFAKGAFAEHEARNLWWDCFEHTYGSIRKQFRVAPTTVQPEAWMIYDTILNGRRSSGGAGWKMTTDKRAVKSDRLRLAFAGVEVDHAEVPYALADHLLPKLAQQGFRRFGPEALSESDVTVLGMKRKLDDGPHGDLHCASTCGTHRFFPSEFWGGIKAWGYLYRKAKSLGMELGHWIAPHFSPRSPYYRRHPEYQMLDALGMPAGGGYSFQTIVAGDWNTGLRQEVFDDLKRWKEEGGLDFLFVDSYSNLGMVQMNYGERMRTNYAAFARFLSDLQKIGIAGFEFECISPLGMARFGVTDLRGDLLKQDHAVAGQNDFGWWVGEEDMAYNCMLCATPRKRTTPAIQQIQFRTMANRGNANLSGLCGTDYVLPPWWVQLNHIYNQVVPHMHRRELLPNGGGVRWTDGKTEILWLYRDQPVPAGKVTHVTATGRKALPVASRTLRGGHVYQIN